MVNSGFGEHGIGSEPDIDKHAKKRKLLAPIFSKQAVRDFEKLLVATFDKFTRIVQVEGSKPEGIDMSEWIHKLMYDLMADLAFGEPSGVMDTGGDSYWVNLVNNNISKFYHGRNMRYSTNGSRRYCVCRSCEPIRQGRFHVEIHGSEEYAFSS
jgi:cytochrome P450